MPAGTAKPPVVLTVDQKQITSLALAIAAEADGKQLRKDLLKDLRTAAKPGVSDLQSAVRNIPAHSLGSPQLRSLVASEIKVAIRTSGPMAGVRFRVGTNKDPIRPSKSGTPVKFKFAGRRLNNGFRHPVFARRHGILRREVWVAVPARPWFEPTLEKNKDTYRDAILKVMDAMADRIAHRAKNG